MTQIVGDSPNGGAGVAGFTDNGNGVYGWANWSGTGTYGSSRFGYGVYGLSASGPGVYGTSSGGPGVYGISQGISAISPPGVDGTSNNGKGVRGQSNTWVGVSGFSQSGVGVHGFVGSSGGVGVIGLGNPGMAGVFLGDVRVSGNLTVVNGNKPFQIDHPLDPQNKYLLHHSVESSDRMNVYDGVAHLDEDGSAWVDLPEWFEALNEEFRYQLTAVGGAAPELHVAEEITENRFKIAGGRVGMKVCWQVTGTRKDRWAAANPFEVEQEKPQEERGRYLQPDLYDAPEEQRVMIVAQEERLRQTRQEETPEPPQYPLPPQEEPPQPSQIPPGAPEMPPGFDFVRLQQQLDELRGQIEELKRISLEAEVDDLRRQIKKLRRRRRG